MWIEGGEDVQGVLQHRLGVREPIVEQEGLLAEKARQPGRVGSTV